MVGDTAFNSGAASNSPIMKGRQMINNNSVVAEQTLADNADTNDTVGNIKIFTQLDRAEEIETLKDTLQGIVNKLGFSDYWFSLVSDRRKGALTTLPENAYKGHLTAEHKDMMVEGAMSSKKALRLSSVGAHVDSAPLTNGMFTRNKMFRNQLKNLGYEDALFLPQKTKKDRDAIFVVLDKGATVEEFTSKLDRTGILLNLLGEAMSFFATEKFSSFFYGSGVVKDTNIILREKPLKLLNVLAKGNLTLKEAAVHLCISLDTANKHIANAKAVLGANTQASAVYRAVQHGLIDLDDDSSVSSSRSAQVGPK